MLILRVSEWGIGVHRVGQNWCSRICAHRVGVHIMRVSILLGCVHCILCKWAHVQVCTADHSQCIVQIPNTVTLHCIASRRIKSQLTIELHLILIPYDLFVAGWCKTCWAKSLPFKLFCSTHLYDGMITSAFGRQSVSKESWKKQKSAIAFEPFEEKILYLHGGINTYACDCALSILQIVQYTQCHYAVHTIPTFLERTNKTVLLL